MAEQRIRARYVRLEKASGRGVAARWASQYCGDGVWRDTAYGYGSSQEKHAALVALGEDPPLSEVDRIVGNQSWTHLWCHGCHDYVDTLVSIGEEYSESHGYCATCIAEAADLMRVAVEP